MFGCILCSSKINYFSTGRASWKGLRNRIIPKYLSTLFGIVFLCHQFGAFLGAYLGGYFYDLYGSYDYAWYIAIALSIFATLIHYPIDERPLIRDLKKT